MVFACCSTVFAKGQEAQAALQEGVSIAAKWLLSPIDLTTNESIITMGQTKVLLCRSVLQ